MKFFEAIKRVESSEEFSISDDAYLVHIFRMFDSANIDEWQVGYYSPSSDQLIVFAVSPTEIRKNPPADAFKRDESAIEPFTPDKISTTPQQAIATAKQMLSSKHPNHPEKQTILLAQTLKEFGQVYNVTIVTETFHMFNVKIATDSGDVVDEKFDHLMSLRKE